MHEKWTALHPVCYISNVPFKWTNVVVGIIFCPFVCQIEKKIGKFSRFFHFCSMFLEQFFSIHLLFHWNVCGCVSNKRKREKNEKIYRFFFSIQIFAKDLFAQSFVAWSTVMPTFFFTEIDNRTKRIKSDSFIQSKQAINNQYKSVRHFIASNWFFFSNVYMWHEQ